MLDKNKSPWCVLVFLMLIAPLLWGQDNKIEQTWSVNFKDSDIHEVIKFVADITEKTFIIDKGVKGQITVLSSEPKNKEELYELFRTILEATNYTLVEVDDVVRVVPIKEARTSPIQVNKSTGDNSEYITEVIQLKNIEAAKVLPVLRPLVPQHSHFAAYAPSNAIVISDSVANIQRVKNVIEQIDRQAVPVAEIVQLKFASAEELVETVKKLDTQSKAQGQANPASNKLVMVPDKRQNAVILSGEDLARLRVKTLIKRLDRPQRTAGDVEVVYLEYAKASEVAETLTKVVQNLSKLKPGGEGKGADSKATVEADESTNSILISAKGNLRDSLLSVVDKLDIRRAQVLIEAIIVEISGDNDDQIGIDWLFGDLDDGVFGSSINNSGQVASIGTALFGDNDNVNRETALAGALASSPGQLFGIGGNQDVDFLALLGLLEERSNTNILSTPTLLTMDNNEASITVGENVPFVTGTTGTGTNGISNPFTTIQREDVGITLVVTPHVNAGDQVLMEISQEISSVIPPATGASDIGTSQRKVETQVLAKDGQVVVLGGLIEDDVQFSQRSVPVLGKIPLLGRLFRSSSSTVRRTNLMVFIKASIVRDDATLMGATAEKYSLIRERQIQDRERGVYRVKDSDLPLLPEINIEDLSLPPEAFEGTGIRAVEEGDDQ